MTPEHALCRAMEYNAGTKVHTAYWNFLTKQYMLAGKCSQAVINKNSHLLDLSMDEVAETYMQLHSEWESRQKKG